MIASWRIQWSDSINSSMPCASLWLSCHWCRLPCLMANVISFSSRMGSGKSGSRCCQGGWSERWPRLAAHNAVAARIRPRLCKVCNITRISNTSKSMKSAIRCRPSMSLMRRMASAWCRPILLGKQTLVRQTEKVLCITDSGIDTHIPNFPAIPIFPERRTVEPVIGLPTRLIMALCCRHHHGVGQRLGCCRCQS